MEAKEFIARRIARLFNEGDIVNLGIGLPAMIANYLPSNKNIWLHAENGIIGLGPKDQSNLTPYSTDAGDNRVTIIPGGAIIDSATSFGIARGGHLSATVLGAMQVDAEGSLANWTVPGGKIAGMGGAMDLVAGAKKVIIATEHCSKDGKSKILAKCTFPLTGYKVVNIIVTELAFIEVSEDGLLLKEIASTTTIEEVISKTDAKLIICDDIKIMNAF